MHINWHGNVFDHSGYASVSRGFLSELHNMGHDISLLTAHTHYPSKENVKSIYEVREAGGSYVRESVLMNAEQSMVFRDMIKRFEPGITIGKHTPNMLMSFCIPRPYVSFPAYEAFPVPQEWITLMNSEFTVDEVWVSSEYCKDIFTRSGLRKPVHIIREGVDTSLFSPNPGCDMFNLRDKFVFLSNFQWIERKAPDILVRAFCEAFGPNDPVHLIMKTFIGFRKMPPEKETEIIARKVSRIANLFGIEQMNPNISIMVQVVPDNSLPDMYNSVDCYVAASRSEGIGRANLEAMSCGLPIITPNCSGMAEYAKKEYAYMVKAEPGKRVVWMDNIGLYYQNAYWYEPDVKDMADKMRYVYDNQDNAGALGKKARKVMQRKYDWKTVTRAMTDRIEFLGGGM